MKKKITMKKTILFCLIIIFSLTCKSESWREFFNNEINQKISDYPRREVDFEKFKQNLENQKYQECLKFLDELEIDNLKYPRYQSLTFTYYFKGFVLAFLNDNSAEDYLLLANDINNYHDLYVDINKSAIWDLANYCRKYSNDSTLYKQTIYLEKDIETNLYRDLTTVLNYKIPIEEIEENYQKLNRPIGIMRIEFYKLINNFSLENTQITLDCCEKILQISKENNIKNYYTFQAERISQKDYFENYKKVPRASIILISIISLIIISLAIYYGIKFKDR